jgi:hypothetical protein
MAAERIDNKGDSKPAAGKLPVSEIAASQFARTARLLPYHAACNGSLARRAARQ